MRRCRRCKHRPVEGDFAGELDEDGALDSEGCDVGTWVATSSSMGELGFSEAIVI